MAIYAKQSDTWYTGNAPAQGGGKNPIYAKWNGTWYAAAGMWVKWNGGWYGAGYAGQPGMCQNQTISSAADNFGQVAVGYWGPAGGAPVSFYIVRMYDYYGNYITGNRSDTPGNQPGLHYFGVSPDTAYQFGVSAVNAAGEGPETPRIHYAIGHAQQTTQVGNYGWGPVYDTATVATLASSEMDGGHVANYACDWPDGNWPLTAWISAARPSASKFDSLRIYVEAGPPADARLYAVRMWPSYGTWILVSLWKEGVGYLGSDAYLDNRTYWINEAAYQNFGNVIVHASAGGRPSNQEYVYYPANEGWDVRAGHMYVECHSGGMTYLNGGYRGGFMEIILQLQNWQIVSYTTVVTVNQQNCYYY